jgi:putative N6-adenine-specific DNA methylase
LVADELDGLGIRPGRSITGGVAFSATTRQLYLANLWLRTATRVLVRIASFHATSFRSLEQHAGDIEWSRWLSVGDAASFRVSSTKSKLYHTDAVAERLQRAAGTGADADERDHGTDGPRFVVRIDHDAVTISVDASGAPLHQRGWRGPQGRAPLRETSAAAMLLAIGWDGREPLIDPMCGSGTIAIEAAMIARDLAPGWQRTFAFGAWPTFEPGTWASVAADAAERARPPGATGTIILATDRDDGAVVAARSNAERAGVADDVTVRRASISELARPSSTDDPGWVVTNPPYGKRASAGADLRNLFARIGQVLRTELPDYSLAVLAPDRRVADHTGLAFEERLAFRNGAIPVRLLVSSAR